MSSYTWSPDAMPMPPEYIVTQYYPFVPSYRPRVSGGFGAGKGCRGGVTRVYPRHPNKCQTCPGADGSCNNEYPDYWNGRNYYNPSGAPYWGLWYGTREGQCNVSRGCLDPLAVNYDKNSNAHCQTLCRYKKPSLCIQPPERAPLLTAAGAACACATPRHVSEPEVSGVEGCQGCGGNTNYGPKSNVASSEQIIYNKQRGILPHSLGAKKAVQWNDHTHQSGKPY